MTLKALFRVRLAALKNSLTGANRSKKPRTKLQILGFAALMPYTFGFFGFFLYETFDTLAFAYSMLGLGWLFFAMAGLMSFGLMFVGSVFTAKAQLYEATDNDLLLSMPIRPRDVLLSRMFLLLVLDLLFGLLVAVPALIAWIGAAGFQARQFVPALLIFVVLLPLLTLMISALFGWLLHLITARMRNQSMMTVVLSLIFLAAYFYFVSQMNLWIQELAANPEPLAGALGAVAPLVWLGRACADGDFAALGGLALIVGGVLILGWMALERSFLRTATDRRGAAKVKYMEKAVDAVPPCRALLRRELKHLAASPAYILNGALGAFMAPVAAIFLLIKRESILPLLAVPGIGELLPLLLLLGLCFISATNILTAPSISIEGKSLWLLQSLPVSPREVLGAKLKMHLLICLPPVLLAGAAAAVLLKPGALLTAALLLLPAACTLFSGLLGLFENLRHPNFDWINETQAVKSGASVLLTMFIGWGTLILPLLVFVIWGDVIPSSAVILGFLGLMVLLCLLLWRWLSTRGVEKFRAL